MKKAAATERSVDMLDEYAFGKGVRGKYAQRYAAGSSIVPHSPLVRDDLIAKAAADAGISKAKAGVVLNSVLDGITGTLKKRGKVAFVGFGTFSVATRAARRGRNPRTAKEIRIPRSTVPKFKAGKKLRDAVG